MHYKCASICFELYKILKNNKIDNIILAESASTSSLHVYLLAIIEGVEIIIDPTISQFLNGFKGFFIGTREQLKILFFNHTGPLCVYQFSELWRKEMNGSFGPMDENEMKAWWRRIWGDKSSIIHKKALS